MKDIIIRPALLGDLELVAKNNCTMSLEMENRELDFEIAKKGVSAVFNDRSKGIYLVAEEKGVVVGQVMITYEWSDFKNSNYWWLQSVFVLPEYRRRGINKYIYEYVVKMAKKQGNIHTIKLYVPKNSESAQKICEALGMTQSQYDIYDMEIKQL